MPAISSREVYGGADARIERLGLRPLLEEIEQIITRFDLRVKESKNANGGKAVRELIDPRFEAAGGWAKKPTGDVDWTKCLEINGTKVCVGVEIQFSARSDLLVVDVAHLRDQFNAGRIDVAVLVVPSDRLSVFLTDRAPSFSDAKRAVKRSRATEDLPLIIYALDHDRPGPALPKRRTSQGR